MIGPIRKSLGLVALEIVLKRMLMVTRSCMKSPRHYLWNESEETALLLGLTSNTALCKFNRDKD